MSKYSQNDEQQHIVEYFQRIAPRHGGRLLDIGAFDGIAFSNTYALLKQGWYGCMVEASPACFAALQRHTEGLNVDLCCTAVMARPVVGMIDFYDNQGAVATTDVSLTTKWGGQSFFQKIGIMPVHFNAILGKYGAKFDMVDIDVEGQSAELFLAMFPDMPDVDLWVVEHDGRQAEIKAASVGFSTLYENGENVVLGRI